MIEWIKGILFLAVFFGSFWYAQSPRYENTGAVYIVFAFWVILFYVSYRSFESGRKSAFKEMGMKEDEYF